MELPAMKKWRCPVCDGYELVSVNPPQWCPCCNFSGVFVEVTS
jgi:rubrerythrin